MIKLIVSFQIKYHPDGPDGEEVEIDFTPPFKKLSMISTLEKILNVKFPSATEFGTSETNKFLNDICIKNQVKSLPFHKIWL